MSQYPAQEATERLAIGLGLFSIGLGLAELAAPRSVARLIGVQPREHTLTTLRAMGAREFGNGVAILAQPSSAAAVWSRVGGDAVDLSLLGAAFTSSDSDRQRTVMATVSVVGITLLDFFCAQQLSRQRRVGRNRSHRQDGVRVEYVTTIKKPIDEVYRFWRNFENFPRFMRHLESVRVSGDRHSHWRAKAPAGFTVEWDAEVVNERENEVIAWRSLPGADVRNSGSVRFEHAPGGRGTEVRVKLFYSPPAGALGKIVAQLFGEEPEQQIREDLRRFKQLMETGEVPLSEGPGLWRPAQPPVDPEQVRSLAGVQS